MCMNKLKQLWHRKKIQRDTTEYSAESVYRVVEEKLKNPNIMPLDSKYKVPTTQTFKEILRKDATDEIRYIANFFDCDGFGFLFKAISALDYHINSIGIVISYKSAHAFNIVVTEGDYGLEVWKLEPQNDRMWKPNKDEKDKYIVEDQTVLI